MRVLFVMVLLFFFSSHLFGLSFTLRAEKGSFLASVGRVTLYGYVLERRYDGNE